MDTSQHSANIKTRYPDHTAVDAHKAVDFLRSIAKNGPMTLVCIAVGGAVRHRVFDTADPDSMRDMRSFIAFQETQPCQVFYLANVASAGCHTVPGNDDIATIRMVVLDFDPDKSKLLEDERDRLRTVAHDLITGPLQPRAIVDTGGGMQVVYELLDHIPVTEGMVAEIELLMKNLARSLGADTATCTAKNLFRVPFTYNWPTPAKKAAGRERSVSGLWFSGGPRCALAALRTLATVSPDDGPASAPVEFEDLSESDLTDVLDDPSALPGVLVDLVSDPLVLKVLRRNPIPDDRSASDFSMACSLLRLNVSPKHTAILLSAYGHKVVSTFQEERLFSYVVHTVEKAVARVKTSHLLDDYEEEAVKEQDQAERRQRHERLKPLTIAEALEGLFDSSHTDMVEGLIGPQELMVLYGKPGSGKTFVMLDLAYHIAQGAAWNERKVRQAKVVYIATESARGILFRLHALYDRYGDTANFYIIPSSVNMFDRRLDLKPLVENIHTTVGKEVGLIVIDTLARAMGGGNENSAQDMTALIENGDRLRNTFGAAIAWVHHSGKNEALGARGSSALLAATDIEVEIADRVFRSTKMRDREHLDYRFDLATVPVGTFPDGREVTTCTVNWLAGAGAFGQSTPGDKNLLIVIEILRLRGQPMNLKEILSEAELMGRKFSIKQNSLSRALNRACESESSMVFTRTISDAPTRNQNLIYDYGLVNW